MSDLKTVEVKGKSYVEVNERLKYFRENFKGYALLTDILQLSEKWVVIKARIINENGKEVANGTAYENCSNTGVNKTSYIENCETSAWGRALGNFGIGIDSSVASADEVKRTIELQNKIDELDTEIGGVVQGSVKTLILDIQKELQIKKLTLNDKQKESVNYVVAHSGKMSEEVENRAIESLSNILNDLRGM